MRTAPRLTTRTTSLEFEFLVVTASKTDISSQCLSSETDYKKEVQQVAVSFKIFDTVCQW